MRRRPVNRHPSILVFRVGQLGDTLVALPAIHAIRRRFPKHRMVLLTDCHPPGSGLVSSWSILQETRWFDEVFFYEPGRWLGRSALDAVFKLGMERFEHVFSLAPRRTPFQLWRDRLLLRTLLGARHYHAAARPSESENESAIGKDRVEPEWLRLLRIVEPDPEGDSAERFTLEISAHERNNADFVLAAMGVTTQHVLVAVGAGSNMPAKHWPEDRFREVGAALLERNANIVLVAIGGPEEQALGDRLCAAWGPRSGNLAGRLGVYGSAAVLARCAAYIGNDSGAMHIAGLVGTPCVAIFSARDVAGKWEPFGKGHVILRQNTECAGCMLRVCTREANKCLTRISADSVLAAAERIISARTSLQ